MKKAILILGIFGFTLLMSSCKKEVIEIVNQPEELNTSLTRSSGEGDDSGIIDGVTDPNEDEDFDADKKNNVGTGQ